MRIKLHGKTVMTAMFTVCNECLVRVNTLFAAWWSLARLIGIDQLIDHIELETKIPQNT
jgi:hypothetical protein